MTPVAVTGIGVATALGTDVAVVRAAIAEGRTAICPAGDERDLLPIAGFAIADVDVRPLLKRRKDRKLLPRAAELAIIAANGAVGSDRPAGMGLFLGVGREPPDGVETEEALIACMRNGDFDVDLLAGPGIVAYPPLAALKTLPNLVLAHVAIQLGCTGEGGTRAGQETAGLAAVVEGVLAIAEGRCSVVLAGGADSCVGPGSARDLVRLGHLDATRAAGEGAAILRLEPLRAARASGTDVLAIIEDVSTSFGSGSPWRPSFEPALGSCGAAAAPLALALGMGPISHGRLDVWEASGARAALTWRAGGR
jgi:3-oxoacyl-[acyl-carrier-protein] synthase II